MNIHAGTESYETTADIKNLITVGETFITESILRSANFFTDENLFFSGGEFDEADA